MRLVATGSNHIFSSTESSLISNVNIVCPYPSPNVRLVCLMTIAGCDVSIHPNFHMLFGFLFMCFVMLNFSY